MKFSLLHSVLLLASAAAAIPQGSSSQSQSGASSGGSSAGSSSASSGGSSAPAPAPAALPPPQTTLSPEQTITSSGSPRTFFYYKPLNYAPSQGVLLYLHGGGGNGSGSASGGTDNLFQLLADRVGVLVIFPDGQAYKDDPTSLSWNDCMDDSRDPGTCNNCNPLDDVQFIKDVVSWTSTGISPAPDLNRIYAMGESKGGQMVERLALEANDVIAAVANVAGNLPVANDNSGTYKCQGYEAPYTPGTNEAVPIFLFKGDDDPRIPYGETEGPDHDQYCLVSDGNQGPPCEKGAVHSYYDTIAFWEWKHNLTPSPTQKIRAAAVTTYADDIPSCTGALANCDASYVVARSFGTAPYRVITNRAVGGGHTFPGPDVESRRQYIKTGWKNRDMYNPSQPYVAELAWAFFTQFTLAD